MWTCRNQRHGWLQKVLVLDSRSAGFRDSICMINAVELHAQVKLELLAKGESQSTVNIETRIQRHRAYNTCARKCQDECFVHERVSQTSLKRGGHSRPFGANKWRRKGVLPRGSTDCGCCHPPEHYHRFGCALRIVIPPHIHPNMAIAKVDCHMLS